MASRAQLQSEAWWGREIVTAELAWLAVELGLRTGQPRDALGTKGNEAHLNGAHRSQEGEVSALSIVDRYGRRQTGGVNDGVQP